jgi:malonyl CoA-acyl carrier protein transacylase
MEIVRTAELAKTVLTNTNHALCHVFSGPVPEIDRLFAAAESEGALRFQRLEVDIPYHHPVLLRDAPNQLTPHLKQVPFTTPRCPMISSIDGTKLSTADTIRQFVAKQLATPINWEQVSGALNAMNVSIGIECGPGISLSQNARFLPSEMKMINVKKVLRCKGPLPSPLH